MKKHLIIIALILLSGKLFAQIPGGRNSTTPALPPPVATREVSGLIKDKTGESIIGATVKLTAGSDTLRTATNEDGIFIFKNVKSATFVVSINGVGFLPETRKYLNNDAVKNIVLDPIVVKTQDNLLNEVKIDGTPSITYKTDTVEYRASDYKVRPNATVDEVLKKMEGMEVGTDGSLTHQGTQVTRAKLNGKEYAGGSVAQAIQNLPADIVDKIQIVDDYGDQAARTGVKDGDPEKILNITTKADKSVGTTGRLTAQVGNNDRFNANLFLQRINANQQLGIIGNFRNTINGVAGNSASTGGSGNGGGGNGGGGGGGSPGVTKTGSPSFNYRDQWGKKTQVVGSYAYTFSNNTATNQSFGKRLSVIGSSDFDEKRESENDNKSHRINFEISHDIDSSNFLQIRPTFSYNNTSSSSNSVTDYINRYTTLPFEHRVENATGLNSSTSKSYGVNAFYLHVFKKPQRNISVQFNINRSESEANTDRNTNTKRYRNSTLDSLVSDLNNHILTDRNNNNTNYSTTATYVEPLSKTSQLQLAAQVRRTEYDNVALTDSVMADGTIVHAPALNNVYNYNVTETRASLNYRYNGAKFNFSLGAAIVPFSLNGNSTNNNTGQDVSTSRSYTRIIPVARFSYAWSRTERLQVTYTGRNNEPNFSQLQPYTDFSNPNNIVIGNPDLKPTFSHVIAGSYNNYLANSKLSLSLNVNATYYDDQVTSNIYRKALPGSGGTFQEVNYVNIDGSKQYGTRYSISKSFSDRAYSISLNGSVNYDYSNAMSEGITYHTTSWNLSQRFGPQLNPAEWLEINPFYEYSLNRTFSTAQNFKPISLQTNSLVLTSRMYFLKTFQVNYRVSKSYVTGLQSLNTSPFIINAGFEKEFFANRSLVLTFNAFDLLHQNNFVQQTVDPQSGSVTNTLSNNLSRYFLVGLRFNIQKWSGRPQRNGRNMQRRGDGSFIYD